MKKIAALSLLIAVAAIVVAVRFWPSRHEAVFYPMGGIPFRVIAYDRSDFSFKDDVRAAENLVEKLEGAFNAHRDSSELSRINREAHGRSFRMGADMARVISSAKYWWEKTGGAFDITVGPLIRLWSEAGKSGKEPSEAELKAALKLVGADKIEIIYDQIMTKIRIKNQDSELQLGGIAKGDIVDQVAEMLRLRGVKRGVIEAGGDIAAFGDGTFSFGIQDPLAKPGEALIGEIEIETGAIVTSGNYERFIEAGGKKYSHIINPKTGMPVDNGLISVTVTGGRCIDADALATALMVLGREKSVEFLRNNPEFKAILVEKRGDKYTVWAPSGLGERIHFEKPWSDWIQVF